MEFQFKYMLLEAISRAGQPISELPANCLPTFLNLEVGGVPRGVSAEISSPVCFWMSSCVARELGQSGADIPGAFSLASSLLEALRSSNSKEMQFELGGDGHINASPNDIFFERFIAAVKQGGASLMFSVEDLFRGPNVSKVPEMAFSGPALLDRVPGEQRDELKLLQGAKPDFDTDDWLMVLALQGDTELEVRPYLNASLGRQNVPWYLRRGLADLKKVISAFDGVDVAQNDLSRIFNISESIGRRFVALLEILVRFRAVYQRALVSERPELLIASLVAGLRSFYSFYNDPTFRRILFESAELQQQGLLKDTVQLLKDLLVSVMELLEFPCGNKSFVLHL